MIVVRIWDQCSNDVQTIKKLLTARLVNGVEQPNSMGQWISGFAIRWNLQRDPISSTTVTTLSRQERQILLSAWCKVDDLKVNQLWIFGRMSLTFDPRGHWSNLQTRGRVSSNREGMM